ncbi:MAG: sterol desaturase family protein, partial [Pseudomonadota bacterium]
MDLVTLTDRIDQVFMFVFAAILLIEIAEMLFKGEMSGKKTWEMLASASTQIPYVAVQSLILTSAYGLYWIISSALPWSIPITWWSIVLVVLIADIAYYWEHRIAHQVRLLWTQHAVHHSSRDMNMVTGIRFGPFEGL